MKDQLQYIVIYRDSTNARNIYFGPFVSDRVASEFEDDLPVPLAGGYKHHKLISPYTHDEADTASDRILNQRLGKSEIDKYLYHQ